MESKIPYIKVVGSYKERGFSHGSQCAEMIKKNIELCKSLCCILRKSSWEMLLRDTKRFVKSIRKYDLDLYIEMEAIAAGAGVTTEEIIFLNVHTELLNPIWNKASVNEGCTSIYVGRKRTAGNKIYLAQTWDWIHDFKEVLIILHSDDQEGHQFITITEAGIIGNMGINNKGIVVLLNFLPINELNVDGVPYHLLLRRVLESKTVLDAQCNVIRSPIAFALNIIVADSSDEVIDIELTAKGIDLHFPENDRLVHTNHLLSRRLKVREGKSTFESSVMRLETAIETLDEAEIIGIDHIKQLYSVHKKKAHEICSHLVGDIRSCTLFTVIFEQMEQELYISFGLPCENEFVKYDLKQLFN
ncbi:peptidase C45 [Anaerocolumna cellulosilytica]|uniref:Peptidase C45 n=1 Tax=Anaerocolumna cellulosilytica TaxID=433286 RepID=A0A6S6R255_9FIRM|nr:C45 family peptidase [Anaerocolumna cellulosilytica]MBB5194880.1 isopenicillin-N N-acyltransferase-like protein [Anaerocolumna cellulosilytica]BCJ94157.1 peptidase C45 [Anaerocolumna cellulosilytica]